MARQQGPATSGPPIGTVEVRSREEETKKKTEERQNKLEVNPRPIPTKGWPAIWYVIKCWFSRLWPISKSSWVPKVPKMTKKEHDQHEKDQRFEYLYGRLLMLSDDIQRVIAVLNSKGGSGKTATAVHLAGLLMWIIKRQVTIVDANENAGTTAKRLGVARKDTLTLRDVIEQINQLNTYEQICMALGSHNRYGVLVVASDPAARNHFTKETFVDMTRVVKSTAHSLVLDCGNGNEWPANEGSVVAGDALVFPALAHDSDTIDDLISTMLVYRQLGYTDKVRNGFIAISATQEGHTKEYIMEQLAASARQIQVSEDRGDGVKLHRHVTLEELGIEPDRIHLIPFSQYIKDNQVVDHEGIGQDACIAYMELLVAIFEQNASYSDEEKVVPQETVTHHNGDNGYMQRFTAPASLQ